MNIILYSNFIKSYVCRENRYILKNNMKFKYHWNFYVLKNSNISSHLLFNKSNPIVLELGFGVGDNLFFFLNILKKVNYIGVEIYKSGIYCFFFKFQYFLFNHVKILYGNFYHLLKKIIYINNFNFIKIFYPDPWNKQKHIKRRILNYDLILLFKFILNKNCYFFIITDCIYYSCFIKYLLDNVYFFVKYYNHGINFFNFIFINSKFNYKSLILEKNMFNFVYYLDKN